MTVSLKTIASSVGVSREAVSHILNGRSHKVSAATREAVLAALKRYDYQTNGLVKALRSKRTNTLGIIVPEVQVSLFAEIISCIESAAAEMENQILITQSHSSLENFKKQVALLRQKRVDGLMIFPVTSCEETDLFPRLLESKMPFVVFLLPLKATVVPHVGNDEVEIGRLATRHLLELGHRKIACMRGYPGALDALQRVEGYCQAMREAGLEVDPRLIVGNNFDFASGQEAAQQLLAQGIPFTGIVAATDMVAVGAIQQLWQAGLQVPKDVSVVGCGDLDVGRYFHPSLTTLNQNPSDLAKGCIRLLFKRIADPDGPIEKETVKSKLVIRQSTARCGQ